jgi:uncharacterized protein
VSGPSPTYMADSEGPLRLAPDVFERVTTAARETVEAFEIPVRSGRAWTVPAGHVCRFSIVSGPQVLDLNLWNRSDPRERFWAARTRQFYGAHVNVGDRLFSTLPFLRPLATIVADTVEYGIDEDGAGCHDLLGTRCDGYVGRMLSGGPAYDFHCHSNLTRAVLPWGLSEYDIHDVINVFQVTGLTPGDERYFMKTCPARVGDYWEIFAEIDLLLAASTCPGGDLSVPIWGPGSGAEPPCHPIGVEVFKLEQGALAGWTPPSTALRPGVDGFRHGLRGPAEHPGLNASG